jgi:hypothetical protein
MFSERQKFDPVDLEIVERVYEVACAYLRHAIYTRTLQNMPKRRPCSTRRCLRLQVLGN